MKKFTIGTRVAALYLAPTSGTVLGPGVVSQVTELAGGERYRVAVALGEKRTETFMVSATGHCDYLTGECDLQPATRVAMLPAWLELEAEAAALPPVPTPGDRIAVSAGAFSAHTYRPLTRGFVVEISRVSVVPGRPTQVELSGFELTAKGEYRQGAPTREAFVQLDDIEYIERAGRRVFTRPTV